jgi:predicted ArsR family transcriptional regulator
VGKVRSLRAAATFVDRVGIALVFPKPDVVLPSLYEAMAGPGPIRWMEELEDGKAVLTDEVARLWGWKDELAAERLVCAGKHVRGWPSLVSLPILSSLYALTERPGTAEDFRAANLSPLEDEVAEVVREQAPVSSREIRLALGVKDTRAVNRALDALQRMLILTRAGTIEQEQGWPGTAYDILARRYADDLRRIPRPEEARANLARVVLKVVGDLSAADLAAALGFRRAAAADALDRLADEGSARPRQEEGVTIWVTARARPARTR